MEIDQIASLKARLVVYARLVEDMTAGSVKAFLEGEQAAARQIIENAERRANQFEVELEEESTALAAQHGPRGKDLRTVLMILGITGDLERMADHAVNIAETVSGRARDAGASEAPGAAMGAEAEGATTPAGAPGAGAPGAVWRASFAGGLPREPLARMGAAVTRMVVDTIAAFIREDPDLASEVCRRDDTVDEMAGSILGEASRLMATDPPLVVPCLALLKVAGNLERIADLSTNICEDVIYMADGRVIKHHALDGAG